MNRNNSIVTYVLCVACSYLGMLGSANSMGLRSFVALPVEKDGVVIRLLAEHADKADADTLNINAAYGISARQTLLLGLPYRLSPSGRDRVGDASILYRHIVRQQDSPAGTDRFGMLAGAVLPTDNDRDTAIQAGVVFTHFRGRNEVDMDVLFQLGLDNRNDSGRYDISWQYRLSPVERPEWGLVPEVNSVLELNGRWTEGNSTTHQLTVGLQWIHQKMVIEGGVVEDLNTPDDSRFVISTRFHF